MHGGTSLSLLGQLCLNSFSEEKSLFLEAPVKEIAFQNPATQIKLSVHIHKW